jgi:hypothetical protein
MQRVNMMHRRLGDFTNRRQGKFELSLRGKEKKHEKQ